MPAFANFPLSQQLPVSGSFGPSGPGHGSGLVPDPGSVAGTKRFLREDSTWQEPSVVIDAANDYGVSTSGDQTTNIGNALTEAGSGGLRTIVRLPAGTLIISNVLGVPPGCSLIGAGMFKTILQQNISTDVVNLGGSGSTVSDLTITVSSGHTVGSAAVITSSTVTGALFSRLNIDSTIGGGTITTGIHFAASSGGYFNIAEKCRIKSCGQGVLLDGTSSLEALLFAMNISTCTDGIVANNAAYFKMIQCETLQCTNTGFTGTNSNFDAIDCIFDSNTGNNWTINWNTTTNQPSPIGWYARLSRCWGNTSTTGRGFAFFTTGGAGVKSRASLSACTAWHNWLFGITFTGAAGTAAQVQVDGSDASYNNAGDPNPGDHGMYFNTCRVTLAGNVADFNTGTHAPIYGILCDTAVTGGTAVGNAGTGNTTAAFHDSSGTVAVAGNN